MIKPNGLTSCLRRWSRLDLSVQRSFCFFVESRCWYVVSASWFSCSGHSGFVWSHAVGVWFWLVGFVMPQTFVLFTGTRNDKTERVNLLLEKMESPGSQRTAVILVLSGVTLLVRGFGQ